jgi:hypothetical protein
VLAEYPEMGHRYLHSSRNVRVLHYGHFRIAYLIKADGDVDILGVFMARSTSRSTSCEMTSNYELQRSGWYRGRTVRAIDGARGPVRNCIVARR